MKVRREKYRCFDVQLAAFYRLGVQLAGQLSHLCSDHFSDILSSSRRIHMHVHVHEVIDTNTTSSGSDIGLI